MIYKIIVDKQPMTNPSNEKKEYNIDIEELRYKGSVYDSLVITADEDYVMRRLELTEFHVLNVLEPPIKQPLEDINIELFQGDNYIYLYEMEGNRLVGKYLVNNAFNQLYVTRSEMNSSITQSVNAIELSVSAKFEDVDGEISDIQGKLELKVDKDDNDQVVSMLNASANLINIIGNRIYIKSDKFELTPEGQISVVDGYFEIKLSNNKKLADFSGNGLRYYNDVGNEIGGLISTEFYNTGKLTLTLYKGESLNIAKTAPDGSYFTYFMSFYDLDEVPFIRNTSNGTLFPDNSSGGIRIQNGLITDFSLHSTTCDLSNVTITGIKVSNGLVESITYYSN